MTAPTSWLEARALHDAHPAADLHADPLLWARFLGYDLLRRHTPPLPRAALGGHVDVPRLREGGIGLQVFGLVSLPGLDPRLDAACDEQIDCFEDAVRASAGALRFVRTRRDLDAAVDARAVAGILAIEGAHALTHGVASLEHFVRRGVRSLGLLHFSSNAFGRPARGLGEDTTEGLTAAGRELVEACDALGVLLDLAHINRRGFFEVCALTKRPVVVSHTGAAGVHSMWRNVDDDALRAVADHGGAVGVIFVPGFLGGDGVEAVVRHLLHIVDVAGEDTPALGSDWDGFVVPTKGLEDAAQLPRLTDALRAHGVPDRVIVKIVHGNAHRLYRSVLPAG